MIRIGVIGYGYWGPNLVRNFAELKECELVGVADLDKQRLSLAKRRYPFVTVHQDYRDLLDDSTIDAVAIATPISSHYEIASRALRAGKHVLVEKPLAASSKEAEALIRLSKKKRRVLMVDHTFVYTGSVRKIKEMVSSDLIGTIYYYDSVRVNLGLFQRDVSVIWDLAVHDVSIMDYVLKERPYAVSATGMSNIHKQPENIAYLTLFFRGNLIAHIHVNWLAPVKVRRTLIGGSKKMIVYNDIEPSEKVKVYDKGVHVKGDAKSIYRMMVSYRTGNMFAPELDISEALRVETAHFIRCIEKKESPVTDSASGLRVVRILEAASQSMAQRGKLIKLNPARARR